MKTIVIHNPARVDRLANIEKLRESFPDLEVFNAIVPEWDTKRDSRCLRGCTASHLIAARHALNGTPVLVLEDDAELVGDVPDFSLAPRNAGIVFYGAEITQNGDEETEGFRRFFGPFWGTHAVLYKPHPHFGTFLIEALTSSSFLPFGYEDGAFCAESIIYNAAQRAQLPMCRPNSMSFTTIGDVSESSGEVMSSRKNGMVVVEKPSLLPLSSWYIVFDQWRGKKAHLIHVTGNAGDGLINAATRQLFKHYGIKEVPLSEAEVAFYPGGASIAGRYPFREQTGFNKLTIPKVVLPQSLERADDYLDAADIVWLRDHTSVSMYPRAKYAPDLALAYRTALNAPNGDVVDIAFRSDFEANPDIVGGRDPVFVSPNHYAYIAEAAKAKEIHTNRLHYAIAGLILGKDVTLYPNDYHKNRSVWEAELAALGCKWKDLII